MIKIILKISVWTLLFIINVPFINNKPLTEDNIYSDLNTGKNIVGIICGSVVKVIWVDTNYCIKPYTISISSCYDKRLVDSILTTFDCPDSVQGFEINNCSMVSLPDNFCQYRNLQHIILNRTYNGFPECIKNFDKVNNIIIQNYDAVFLPRNIELFENIEYLTLDYCPYLDIESLFHVISKMKNLRGLLIFHDYRTIDTLPREIGELKNLRKLNMNDIEVKVIPKELAQCRNLKSLWVGGKPKIPKAVLDLPKIEIYSDWEVINDKGSNKKHK